MTSDAFGQFFSAEILYITQNISFGYGNRYLDDDNGLLLAPKVLLDYLRPMITIQPNPTPSIQPVRHKALNELNRPKIDLSQPKMT